MINKTIIIVVYICFFLIYNSVCRRCSAYFPKSRCKKYIYIKNNTLADILITKSISTDKFVSPIDYNKISIIGVISYFFIGIPNICGVITKIVNIFIKDNMLDFLHLCSFSIASMFVALFLFISEINTSKCKNR